MVKNNYLIKNIKTKILNMGVKKIDYVTILDINKINGQNVHILEYLMDMVEQVVLIS